MDSLLLLFTDAFQLELLAAKNLIGANINGTSDPYAVITCGTEKRFRSLIAYPIVCFWALFKMFDDAWEPIYVGGLDFLLSYL